MSGTFELTLHTNNLINSVCDFRKSSDFHLKKKKSMDGIDKYNEFVRLHGNQLTSSGVPQTFWHTLCRKLNEQIFDAGDAFSLMMIEYDEGERQKEDPLFTVVVSKPDGIQVANSTEIYLIDHAWTYRLHNAREQLRQIPALLNRLSIMMGCSDLDTEDAIECVMESMWRYNQMYAIGSSSDSNEIPIEDRMPVWYIMDEVGSAINHSDSPNFRVVPFMHLPEGITYSLMFPTEDLGNLNFFI